MSDELLNEGCAAHRAGGLCCADHPSVVRLLDLVTLVEDVGVVAHVADRANVSPAQAAAVVKQLAGILELQ